MASLPRRSSPPAHPLGRARACDRAPTVRSGPCRSFSGREAGSEVHPAHAAHAARRVAHAEGPVVFHCTAGKDRTGVLAALMLAAVGADRGAIVADYAATSANLAGEWARKMLADHDIPALEVEDLVTLRDVVHVLQRTEMVRRIADEINADIVQLGVDGRLVALQLEELMGGVEDDRRLVEAILAGRE